MGKYRRRSRKNDNSRSKKTAYDKETGSNNYPPYKDVVRENAQFTAYYKALGLVPPLEWDAFIATLQSPLPTTFRFAISAGTEALIESMKRDYADVFEGSNPPQPLLWYPEEVAFRHTLSRHDFRHNPSLRKFHQFLVTETDIGAINRQEAVSMIPPLFLDVQPQHKVLDLCAAPGSKTAQLLEALHKSESCPEGVVVANDVNNQRCYTLAHQLKRFGSPCLLVTNHDASQYPLLMTPSGPVVYDRILCDVPCSGDGTFRKNTDIWMSWSTRAAFDLHTLQLNILQRAVELLQVGGRIVYSTCSLNPLENEAVIGAILDQHCGLLNLVDVSTILPLLKRIPGLSEWKVISKQDVCYTSYSDVPEEKKHIKVTNFPPGDKTVRDTLKQCVRIMPHHMDTGGFFVAVLEKTKPMNPSSLQSITEYPSEPRSKKPKFVGWREDPFYYINPDTDDSVTTLKEFYGVNDIDFSLLLKRSEEGRGKKVYKTNSTVRDLLSSNDDKKMKVINAGVPLLMRTNNLKDAMGAYRLVNDGIHLISDKITLRKIFLKNEDMITLLSHSDPMIVWYSAETQTSLEDIPSGSMVIQHSGDIPFVLSAWKGKSTLKAYVKKEERMHYLRVLGISDVERFFPNVTEGKNESSEIVCEESALHVSSVDGDITEEVDEANHKLEGDKSDFDRPTVSESHTCIV